VKGPPARHEEQKEQLPAVEGIISDAADLEPGDRVVYPNQGVCRITGIELKEIAGQRLELVRMEREEDGAAVMVPKGKVPSIGLRKVASGDQIEGVFHYLAAQYDDPELDWKVRHRDNADRLIAGGVLGVAEVVKGLHALSRIRPLPAKEREQYDNARHLLVHEVAVSLVVAPALAEDYIDYALMPPAGVTFKLKPPPRPVELPQRQRRRVTRTAEDDDLGLDDLGLDLGVDEVVSESGAAGEDGGEGAEAGAASNDGETAPAIPTPEDIPVPEGAEGADLDLPPEGDEESGLEGEGEADEPEDRPSAVRKGAGRAEKPGRAAPADAKGKKAAAAPKKAAEKAPRKPAPKKAAPRPAAAKKPARGGKKK
jgi:RNA polymerase-interacting CarD/CdnL/TRCF family regulator